MKNVVFDFDLARLTSLLAEMRALESAVSGSLEVARHLGVAEGRVTEAYVPPQVDNALKRLARDLTYHLASLRRVIGTTLEPLVAGEAVSSLRQGEKKARAPKRRPKSKQGKGP